MIDATKILPTLPKELRSPLSQTYQEIAANFAEHRWEPSELNDGKFCEVVYSIIAGALSGTFWTPQPFTAWQVGFWPS